MRDSQGNQRVLVSALILVMLNSWLGLQGSFGENPLGDPANVASVPASLPDRADSATRAKVTESYGNLPLSFEANEGQTDSRVKFISRTGGQTVFLTSTEAVFSFPGQHRKERPEMAALSKSDPYEARRSEVESSDSVLRMKLVGANPSPRVTGVDEQPGKSNYFLGNDPSKWRMNVANYARVKYEQVYPGLDLVYYGNSRQLEYDLIVAPGADPRCVRLAFEGADRIHIDRDGDLILGSNYGEVRQHKPVVYQEVNGTRTEVAAHYVVRSKNHIGVSVSHYDTDKPLIIDPVLTYSTYLGGSDFDEGTGIAVDSAGNAYVVGETSSLDYPVKNALQPSPAGEAFRGEAFVTKLNSSGTALMYSTYLGGSDNDSARAVAVDIAGNAYLTGITFSTNFPTASAFQPTHTGLTEDAFVTKLNANGSALLYSTYLGGSDGDQGYGITVDSLRHAYVTGGTASSDFPTANPLQAAWAGGFDAFITKFAPDGTSLAYSTYLGGTGSEIGRGVAVDSSGQTYVAGLAASPDFPLASPLQSDYKGRTAFKSLDAGSQWEAINNGLPETTSVLALAVDGMVLTTIYAGTLARGLFKSTDGGASWVAKNLSNAPINALAVDPHDSNVVFAGTNFAVFKSTNGGGSWTQSRFGPARSLGIDPSNPSVVYAGNLNGISKSTNGGATWVNRLIIDQGSGSGTIGAIAIDPITPATLYAASSTNLIFKSVNGGLSWQAGQGLIPFGFNSLAIDPATPSTIYAGSRSLGVFKSTDGGDTWVRSLAKGFTVNALAIDAGSVSTIYAGTFGDNLFKSTDGGNTWASFQGQLGNSFINALAIGGKSTIYAGAGVAGDGFASKLSATGSSLMYSTYFGGDDLDYCTGIAIDGTGNAYMTGQTYSYNLPTANPVQLAPGGSADAFLAKLTVQGSALVYSTYLGGGDEDIALGIAVEPGGDAYITGLTYSSDFPLINPLTGILSDLDGNAFVAKLNRTGSGFDYSTYLGGQGGPFSFGGDLGTAIAVDSGGNAYVTGDTYSDQFPITPGAFQPATHGGPDSFVSKLSVFDVCLQDDANANLLQVNSASGDYVFDDCRKGIRLSGRGVISIRGCKIELRDKGPDHKRPDRDVYALANSCSHSGSGSITLSSVGRTFTITDTSTTNSTCLCAR